MKTTWIHTVILQIVIVLVLLQATNAYAAPSWPDDAAALTTPKFLTLPFNDTAVRLTNAWLATGSACSYYSIPCQHKGIDYTSSKVDSNRNPITFNILAAAEGTATCYPVGTHPKPWYGNYVDVKHLNGLSTRYAHLQRCEFSTKKVIRGDYIGKAGNTSDKPLLIHLHFELIVSGISTDPYGLNTTKDRYPQPGIGLMQAPASHYWRDYAPKYPTKPSVPMGLKASDAAYTDKVVVTWSPVADTSWYELWRKNYLSTAYPTIISTNASSGYPDYSATGGVIYSYYVTACNSLGCSGWSQPDSGSRIGIGGLDYGPSRDLAVVPSSTPMGIPTSTARVASLVPTNSPAELNVNTLTPTVTSDLPGETPTASGTDTPLVTTFLSVGTSVIVGTPTITPIDYVTSSETSLPSTVEVTATASAEILTTSTETYSSAPTAIYTPEAITVINTPTSTATLTLTNTPTAISTPSPTVLQPVLAPPYSGNICDQSGIPGHAWYRISGGAGGPYAYLTLNAFTSGSTNSAIWRPNFGTAGHYKVEIYIPDHSAIFWPCTQTQILWDTAKAKYQIYYQGGNTSKVVNLAPLSDAWVEIGTYYFAEGTNGYILLTDLTGEAFATRTIPFSAVRFTYVSP